MYRFLAILMGVLITIMVTFNAGLSTYVGLPFSLVIIHSVGIVTVLIVIFVRKVKFTLKSGLPFYYYLGGGIGVIMLCLNTVCVNQIGASLTLAIGILGQLIISSLIDNFGLFGMNKHKFIPKKLIGFAIIIGGLFVMIN